MLKSLLGLRSLGGLLISVGNKKKIDVFISKPNYILWSLKRTVKLRHFFEHPKQLYKAMYEKYSQVFLVYNGLSCESVHVLFIA